MEKGSNELLKELLDEMPKDELRELIDSVAGKPEKNKIERFTLIEVEWNIYNGFVLSFLSIADYNGNINGSLFAVFGSRSFLYINLFFKVIKIFDKTL
jgi:hypothetical protein